jgi:membrane-bound metal-dependent hydrolase YbcI (DUF457 family)
MGPAVALKACLQGGFSLMVFGWAQVVMDVQPLAVMLTGHGHLHGFSHTYIGATLLGAFSALSGKYLSELGLRVLGHTEFLPISWFVACVSALIGTYSHVALDSIMHGDIEPLAPFTSTNLLLGLISIEALHWFCAFSGLVGAVVYYVVARMQARRSISRKINGSDGRAHCSRGRASSRPVVP